MHRLVIYCFSSFVCFNAISQRTIDIDKDPNVNGGILQNVFAVGGKPFVTAKFSKVVEGSPFFTEQMMHGAIILSEGKEYKNLLLRLNLLESQVNYIGEKQVEMIASTPIQEVVLRDSIQKIDHRFIFSDSIETPDRPEKGFYEILQAGKAELYKQYKKRLLESKPYGSATTEQTIQTELRYFILVNGQWIRIKKMKDITDAFYKKKKEIEKFITDNKIAGGSEANLEAITAYYNSLFATQ